MRTIFGQKKLLPNRMISKHLAYKTRSQTKLLELNQNRVHVSPFIGIRVSTIHPTDEMQLD